MFPSNCKFLFLRTFWFCLGWVVLFPLSRHFPLLIISMANFSTPNSIHMSWLYILTTCMRDSYSFPLLGKSLMSSMYVRRLMFSCDFISLYSLVHFLSMWLSGIIAMTNSNGDIASPWNIPFWIFASDHFFLLPSIPLSAFPSFLDKL